MNSRRWTIPLAAVLIHICIGSIYAWSTLNRPIQAVLPHAPWWFSPPYITFTTALVLLGLSAAFGGPWVERRGPRTAATAAACLFGTGLVIGGFGLSIGQSVLVFLGMGVIGGIGAGLGYIAPVSTLIKWFPDRRGMATGMAIMGFGGGAFLAGYLNVFFINRIGVARTVMALGAVYFVIMIIGARIIKSAPAGYRPAHWEPPTAATARTGRAVLVTLYVIAMLAGVGAIGLFVSTLTEVPIAAMAAVIVLTIVSEIVDAIPQLSVVHPYLFTHPWLAFGDLLREPMMATGVVHGLLTQLAYVVVFGALAWARFTSKDITS